MRAILPFCRFIYGEVLYDALVEYGARILDLATTSDRTRLRTTVLSEERLSTEEARKKSIYVSAARQ
jgi:hypothetical protein